MDEHYEQLVEYARAHIFAGTPEQQIRASLVQAGWSEEWVHGAITHARGSIFDASQLPTPAHLPADSTVVRPEIINTQALDAHAPVILPRVGIFDAIRTVAYAWRFNWRALVVALLAIVGVYVIGSFVFSFALSWLGTFLEQASLQIAFLLSVFVYSALAYLLFPSFVAASSLVIFASEHQHKTEATEVLSSVWRRFLHLLRAAIAQYFVIWLPWIIFLIVTAVLPMLPTNTDSSSADDEFAFLWIYILAAAGVAVITVVRSIRYALVWAVALFEPGLTIRQILQRSQALMSSGGFVFCVKMLPILLLNIVLILIANSLDKPMHNLSWFVFVLYVLAAFVGLFWMSLFTVFYLRRKS